MTTFDFETASELCQLTAVKISPKISEADYPHIYPRASILRPATTQKPRMSRRGFFDQTSILRLRRRVRHHPFGRGPVFHVNPCGNLAGLKFGEKPGSHTASLIELYPCHRVASALARCSSSANFRAYPHFYPQADGPSESTKGCNSVHNRHGDIFVNNRLPTREKRATTACGDHREAWAL